MFLAAWSSPKFLKEPSKKPCIGTDRFLTLTHPRWDYESNVRYAQTAENVGFEFALTQIRFMAGYGAENQHESVSFSQALLHNTKKLNVIAALLPGPWNPAIAAKQIASIDHYSGGRVSVNVVSGWFKAEFVCIVQSVWVSNEMTRVWLIAFDARLASVNGG